MNGGIMNKPISLWVTIVFLMMNCDATDQGEILLEFSQVPGCSSSSVGKTTLVDLCFDYEFSENLRTELCLPANCYPDSSRFSASYLINNNTITFTVVDTAQNMAKCFCDYKIVDSFTNLELNTYLFQCVYQDSIFYSENVERESDY